MLSIKKILVSAEGEHSIAAINRGFAVAKRAKAKVTLMNVIKPIPSSLSWWTDAASPAEIQDLLIQDHEAKLRHQIIEHGGDPDEHEVIVKVGDTAGLLAREVVEHDYDFVIRSGTAGKERNYLDSVSQSLMRNCPCPVWIMKPEIFGSFDRVMVAVDVEAGDKTHQSLNQEILEYAAAIAANDDAELHVVCVWDIWMEAALRRRSGDQEVDEMRAKHAADAKAKLESLVKEHVDLEVPVILHVANGTPAPQILGLVEHVHADLLVMGTVCRTGVAGFLIGNTAVTLLTQVPCSVLAAKPEGFVSPIQASSP